MSTKLPLAEKVFGFGEKLFNSVLLPYGGEGVGIIKRSSIISLDKALFILLQKFKSERS